MGRRGLDLALLIECSWIKAREGVARGSCRATRQLGVRRLWQLNALEKVPINALVSPLGETRSVQTRGSSLEITKPIS